MRKITRKNLMEAAAIIPGIIATVIATLAYAQSLDSQREVRRASVISRQLEANRLLHDAWDLMAGQEGARVIHWPAKRGEEATKNYELAVRKIELARALNPVDRYPLNMHSCAARLIDHSFHESVEEYRKAIAIRPDSAQAHYNLGSVLVASRRYKEALDAFATSLELDPLIGSARRNRQLVILPVRELEEMLLHARESLDGEADPKEAEQDLVCAKLIIRNRETKF